MQVLTSVSVLKIDSNTGASCGYCKIFKNSFLIQHLRWLLLTVLPRHSKASWAACFWFRASTCFRFRSKTFTKRCYNNSLLSRDKSIPSLLDLIGHVLLISEYVMFWKNNDCFRFWWKTYIKCCASNYVISRVKRLSFPTFCGWSGAFNFREWFGKWNMVVKIPILILFLFCLLCWLKNHLFWVLSLLQLQVVLIV